jgi:ubiquinone/menaquinone biosynthesis C-methylase UbiE
MQISPYRDPGVASTYSRLAAPVFFAAPARDLVTKVHLRIGDRVLDVGTGPGTAAAGAKEIVEPAGWVVGIDPSIQMLDVSSIRRRYPVLVAGAPGLPFRDDVFDAVLASFVLTHIEQCSCALADMIRVCRPGGKVGVTTWGASSDEVSSVWRQIVARYVPVDQMDRAVRHVIPHGERFADAGNLERALRDADFTSVTLAHQDYLVTMTLTDYLSTRSASVEGRIVREMLDARAWSDFARELAAALDERFGHIVEYTREVLFAIGVKCR